MDQIRVREASRKDLDAVYEIEKQSFSDPYPMDFLGFLYETDRETFLVAEKKEDGAVAGYVIAAVEKNLGHIISIAVHPLERNRGVGTAVMCRVLKLLKASGATSVRLEVRQSNVEAQSFYETLDFKCSHVSEKYYGDENALIYFKQL